MLGVCGGAPPKLWARDFRVDMIPNGSTFSCANCHFSPFGGDARNPFGVDVSNIVGGFSPRPFWSPALAAKDSDGDGTSNGEELGDPDGDGVPTPGVVVTNPGDATSKPPSNLPPSVAITLPRQGAVFSPSELVTVEASASDSDGTIATVEFHLGSTVVFKATKSPYAHTFAAAGIPPGKHSFTAKAIDDSRATTISAPVEITISEPQPLAVTALSRSADTVKIVWRGGVGPFVLQRKTSLSDSTWSNERASAARELTTSASGQSVFYRVFDVGRSPAIPLGLALDGAAERPTGVNTAATGSGEVRLEANTLVFTISYSGLTGTATAAHIHGPATASDSAGVLIDLAGFNGGAFGSSGLLSGSLPLTAEQVAIIANGEAYVNLHTAVHPGGEIRGQLIPRFGQTP
ncbi:MAG: CHRD domain-containing protein [Verrucomicrobia bacterium]|nr:CHRD domain-containing protein [Verrucomicrobiota bacterium]